jgi:peptidoglycan/LPS O-acetylase OafA/YrhL
MSSSAAPVKLLNVQGLRAYGALAVAFYHTGFSLNIGLGRPIGSFGVSIFFLISGFIMAMICDLNPEHFLLRRIARIVPLYWLLTLALFAAGSLNPTLMGKTTLDGISLLKSLFFIPYITHGSYFPILFLGWSLNYEMYFYLLLAGALLIYQRGAALLASGVMVAVLLVLRLVQASGAVLFYAHPIILEFVLGVLCYYGFRAMPNERILAHRGLLRTAMLLAAGVMIVTAIYTIGSLNAVIVGITATILVFCAVLLDKVGMSLRRPSLIALGDASYVIYLVHPYFGEFLNKIVARRFAVLETTTLLGMFVALSVTVVVSAILYRLVDNPLHLFFRNLLCKPAKLPVMTPAMRPVNQ